MRVPSIEDLVMSAIEDINELKSLDKPNEDRVEQLRDLFRSNPIVESTIKSNIKRLEELLSNPEFKPIIRNYNLEKLLNK